MPIARRLLITAGVFTALLAAAAALLVLSGAHRTLIRRGLERALNARTQDRFAGSIRLGPTTIDRRLRLQINGMRAMLQTAHGPVPLAIDRITSETSLLAAIRGRPLTLRVDGLHLRSSPLAGVRGVAQWMSTPHWRIELRAEVIRLGLDELIWIDPAHLTGSTGEITGDVALRVGEREEPFLSAALRIDQPGGLLQARFFDLLTPYLPTLKELPRAGGGQVVAFRNAQLDVRLPATDWLKIFLHITVPEYNLDLNLNVDVHVDDRDILKQFMRLGGMVHAS